MGTLLVTSLLLYYIPTITGEIRCYCNEPKCVISGYMCKSANDMCYVIQAFENEVPRHTQGCADTLISTSQNLCKDEEYRKYRNAKSTEGPVVRCCSEDMCNFKFQSNSSNNEKNDKLNPSPPGSYIDYTKPEVKDRLPERDLWFKAAVIAVPIAGGFILVLLVLLAVRMLRSDSRRHRQLIRIRRERTSLTKAQLYVTDHFCEKIENTTSPLFGGKHNPVYKTEKDSTTKVFDKSPDKKKKYPTILIFGKPPKKDFASVV